MDWKRVLIVAATLSTILAWEVRDRMDQAHHVARLREIERLEEMHGMRLRRDADWHHGKD